MPIRWIPRLWWMLCSRAWARVLDGKSIHAHLAVMAMLRWWDRWLNPWYTPPSEKESQR